MGKGYLSSDEIDALLVDATKLLDNNKPHQRSDVMNSLLMAERGIVEILSYDAPDQSYVDNQYRQIINDIVHAMSIIKNYATFADEIKIKDEHK